MLENDEHLRDDMLNDDLIKLERKCKLVWQMIFDDIIEDISPTDDKATVLDFEIMER